MLRIGGGGGGDGGGDGDGDDETKEVSAPILYASRSFLLNVTLHHHMGKHHSKSSFFIKLSFALMSSCSAS